jgi:hypothetical protein
VLLQETFSHTNEACYHAPGFVGHHALASASGGPGRPRWGLTSLFKINSFLEGSFQRLFSSVDWVLVSRWGVAQGRGIIFVNTYMPIHSGGVQEMDLQNYDTLISDLRLQYPADTLIMGGDFNFDPWRCSDFQSLGITVPPLVRCVSICFMGFD